MTDGNAAAAADKDNDDNDDDVDAIHVLIKDEILSDVCYHLS